MHNHKQMLTRTLISLAVLALSACASMEPGRLTTETSTPRLVDARADNAAVMADQVAGLVVTLKIDDSRVELADSRVMMIPKGTARRQEGELITLAGLSGGRTVTQIQVPDQRLNVEENKGIVILGQRTVQAALPLPAPIDELQVLLPGAEQPVRISVGKEIAAFCREHPKHDLCRQR
jgi:hypothetical protein